VTCTAADGGFDSGIGFFKHAGNAGPLTGAGFSSFSAQAQAI
jgi:hypothetical protein